MTLNSDVAAFWWASFHTLGKYHAVVLFVNRAFSFFFLNTDMKAGNADICKHTVYHSGKTKKGHHTHNSSNAHYCSHYSNMHTVWEHGQSVEGFGE